MQWQPHCLMQWLPTDSVLDLLILNFLRYQLVVIGNHFTGNCFREKRVETGASGAGKRCWRELCGPALKQSKGGWVLQCVTWCSHFWETCKKLRRTCSLELERSTRVYMFTRNDNPNCRCLRGPENSWEILKPPGDIFPVDICLPVLRLLAENHSSGWSSKWAQVNDLVTSIETATREANEAYQAVWWTQSSRFPRLCGEWRSVHGLQVHLRKLFGLGALGNRLFVCESIYSAIVCLERFAHHFGGRWTCGNMWTAFARRVTALCRLLLVPKWRTVSTHQADSCKGRSNWSNLFALFGSIWLFVCTNMHKRAGDLTDTCGCSYFSRTWSPSKVIQRVQFHLIEHLWTLSPARLLRWDTT